MLTTRHNIVLFRFGSDFAAEAIPLTLQGEWIVSGGMQPNCNTAVVPIEIFGLLELDAYPSGRVGSIEFWWTQPPSEEETPDHVIAGIWLVDAQPEVIGKRPGEAVNSVQAMRLCFADHRHGFVEPRGGRLNQGELNPLPAPDGYTLKTNSELIGLCQTAMGLSASVPSSVNDIEPARDINWLGDHAPAELAKMLEFTGHVYAVHASGLGFIALPGAGGPPVIPAPRLNYNLQSTIVDRRPAKALFYSAPTAAVRTYDQNAQPAPNWQYVAQDHEDGFRWKPIIQIPALSSAPEGNVLLKYRNGFRNVDAPYREHYKRQVYKCIQLDTIRFEPRKCPILKRVHYPDGTVFVPHLVATIATQESDSAWVNRPAMCKAKTVVGEFGVLVFDSYLGTVTDGEKPDHSSYFAPLTQARVTFSVEDWDGPNDEKLFFVAGYTTAGGTATAMNEATARAHLKSYRPDTAIYQCPDLRLVTLNDGPDNKTEITSRATKYATRLMQTTALTPRTIEVTGFYPMNLDGRVSEIRYSQALVKTTIILDGWNFPSFSADGQDEQQVSSIGNADAGYPNRQVSRRSGGARQKAEDGARKDGASLFLGTNLPAAPDSPAPSGLRDVWGKATSAVAGEKGHYNGRSYSGKINTAAAGAIAEAHLGALSTTDDLIIWNPAEAISGGGALSLNVPIAMKASTLHANGKLICIATVGGGGFQKARIRPDNLFIQFSFSSNPTQSSDWIDAIPLTPCSSSAARGRLYGGETGGGETTGDGMELGPPLGTTQQIEAATTLDGTGAVELFQAITPGGAVFSITVTALASTEPNVIDFFHQPGGAGSKLYFGSLVVVKTNLQSGLDLPWQGTWFAPNQTTGLRLSEDDKVYAGPRIEQKFNVKPEAFTLVA